MMAERLTEDDNDVALSILHHDHACCDEESGEGLCERTVSGSHAESRSTPGMHPAWHARRGIEFPGSKKKALRAVRHRDREWRKARQRD